MIFCKKCYKSSSKVAACYPVDSWAASICKYDQMFESGYNSISFYI